MTHDLHIRWNKIPDPQGHAECLGDILDDLKPDFRSVSYISGLDKVEPERRWWQAAPRISASRISEVGKAFEGDIPTWKIGWWDDPRPPSMAVVSLQNKSVLPSIPVVGTVMIIFSVPAYKRYLVQNQSALEHLLGREPHEFEGIDSERVEGATRLLHEALYRIGLHPGGPYPPDEFDWKLGL